jgi:hypothetical protein
MILAMAARRTGGLVTAVATMAIGALAAGCGSGGVSTSAPPRHRPVAAPRIGREFGRPGAGVVPRVLPAPGPTGLPADPAAVRVIRAWSTALRRGDVRAAAHYFGLPTVFVNGVDTGGGVPLIVIHTEREAEAINASLPCGAVFISADQRGEYVNALFRLTGRPGPGGGCSGGAGETARTNFVVMGGRIVQWIRAPDDPGDNQPEASPQPPPATPQPPPAPAAPTTTSGPVI